MNTPSLTTRERGRLVCTRQSGEERGEPRTNQAVAFLAGNEKIIRSEWAEKFRTIM